MNESELDELYTLSCRAMSELGEENEEKAQLFLARLSLLLMEALDDPARIRQAIGAARESL
jgi:hypothetical protein